MIELVGLRKQYQRGHTIAIAGLRLGLYVVLFGAAAIGIFRRRDVT
ncbi:MAG: hypothetical protein ACXV8R_13060 [Acidimicrobiia bacterium]